MHRGVVDKYAALLHHFLDVARAQRVGNIPAHARKHDSGCRLYLLQPNQFETTRDRERRTISMRGTEGISSSGHVVQVRVWRMTF